MEIFTKISDWYISTHIGEQIKSVDFVALFSNPWFIVPFGAMVIYLAYKQSWKEIIIIAVLVAVWWASGTEYMNTLIIDDIVQIEKLLPVVFGGAIAIGFVIYLLFGRSD